MLKYLQFTKGILLHPSSVLVEWRSALSLKTIDSRPSEHAASQLRDDLAARIAVQSQDPVHQGICVRSDQSYGHYRRQTDASKLAAEPFS